MTSSSAGEFEVMGWRIEKRWPNISAGEVEYLRDAAGEVWDFGLNKQEAADVCERYNRARTGFDRYFVLAFVPDLTS